MDNVDWELAFKKLLLVYSDATHLTVEHFDPKYFRDVARSFAQSELIVDGKFVVGFDFNPKED